MSSVVRTTGYAIAVEALHMDQYFFNFIEFAENFNNVLRRRPRLGIGAPSWTMVGIRPWILFVFVYVVEV